MSPQTGRRFWSLVSLAVTAACAATALSAATAYDAAAAKPVTLSAILRIHPGGGAIRFGGSQTLEAQVSDPSGAGLSDVEVDFEVTGGPGDRDGNTPQTPDMTCTTAGGDAHHPATCTASYAELLNQDGSDGVLAWIDADGQDITVEADLAEGENENAPGSEEGCAPGTKGPGATPEPDGTDCRDERWLGRVVTSVDVEPEASSGSVGSIVNLAATVRDQFGDPFGSIPGTSTTVSFELLAGSAHDPGDGSDFSSPDLGTCATGPDGGCSVPLTATTAGTDIVCAYVPGASAACSQSPDAPGPGEGGDVVTRSWEVPTPPAPSGQGSEAAPPPPDESRPADSTKRPEKAPMRETPDPPRDSSEPRTSQDRLPAPPPSAEQPAGAPPAGAQPQAPSTQRRPDRAQHATHHDSHEPSRASAAKPHNRHAGSVGPTFAPRPRVDRPVRRRDRKAVPSLGALSQAAFTTAHKLSFPLGLTLLVIAFLGVQGRLDRRDPKLRLAPIDSKHDLLPFT